MCSKGCTYLPGVHLHLSPINYAQNFCLSALRGARAPSAPPWLSRGLWDKRLCDLFHSHTCSYGWRMNSVDKQSQSWGAEWPPGVAAVNTKIRRQDAAALIRSWSPTFCVQFQRESSADGRIAPRRFGPWIQMEIGKAAILLFYCRWKMKIHQIDMCSTISHVLTGLR